MNKNQTNLSFYIIFIALHSFQWDIHIEIHSVVNNNKQVTKLNERSSGCSGLHQALRSSTQASVGQASSAGIDSGVVWTDQGPNVLVLPNVNSTSNSITVTLVGLYLIH